MRPYGRKNPLPFPVFEAVAGLWSAPDYLRKGVKIRGWKPWCLPSCAPAGQARFRSLRKRSTTVWQRLTNNTDNRNFEKAKEVNDLPVDEYALVEDGDTVTFAGIPAIMEPITAEEKRAQMVERRMEGKPAGMWGSLVLLTLFQILTGLQLIIAQGDKATTTIPLTFFVFTVICWAYFIVMRLFRRIGFEMETIAFFLCTLSLAVTGSTVPDELPKQLIAILMGLAIFIVLGFFLRDLTRAQKVRWFMSATAVGLLAITLLIGSSQGGAKAWLRLGPLSLQTSEIAKICYIFAGAATLDRLFNKRNKGVVGAVVPPRGRANILGRTLLWFCMK